MTVTFSFFHTLNLIICCCKIILKSYLRVQELPNIWTAIICKIILWRTWIFKATNFTLVFFLAENSIYVLKVFLYRFIKMKNGPLESDFGYYKSAFTFTQENCGWCTYLRRKSVMKFQLAITYLSRLNDYISVA